MELTTNVKTGDLKINSPEGGTTTAPQETVVTKKTPEPDLITRVSQVKVEPEVKKDDSGLPVEEPKFDLNDIEKIQDPVAKDQALKAYKSFQRGFNDKFQQLAELRKTYETELTNNKTWTKDRIKQIQSDPNFLKVAQEVLAEQKPIDANISDNEWSAMTTSEKQQWHAMQERIKTLETQNQQQAILQQFRQQDEQLRPKYANYDPNAVDIITSELLSNKRQATREDLWKAIDYDSAVKRAYQLGLQDANGENKVKLNSASFDGVNTQPAKEIPAPEKGDNTQQYFRKLVVNNLERAKQTR